jgi:glycopeptide antibiotics resistance protein
MWIIVIVFLTTMPWENYTGHAHWDQVRWIPFYDHTPLALLDILGNVVLFAPFGFFLGRALHSSPLKKVWFLTVLLAATLSISVELFQVYCHNRIPSTTDICTNLLGAALGVLLR